MVSAAQTAAVRYREPRPLQPRTTVNAEVAAAMAAMCETCGEPVARGAVTRGPLRYCSVECALSGVDGLVPANYLG
jgi:hypothetical protein